MRWFEVCSIEEDFEYVVRDLAESNIKTPKGCGVLSISGIHALYLLPFFYCISIALLHSYISHQPSQENVSSVYNVFI